jgi:signal transduction histidine kinase
MGVRTVLKRLFCIFLRLFALLSSMAAAAGTAETWPEQGFTVLENASMVVSSSRTPPPDSADWQTTTMPYHNRGVPMEERPTVVWLRFNVANPGTASAVYLYRYQTTAQFYLNDLRLGGTEEHNPYGTTSYWNHPLYVDVPEAAWQPGQNQLYLRVLGRGYGPVSSPVLFGDPGTLFDLWESRNFRQVQISNGAFFLCIALAALALWLWYIRPEERLFAYYAVACLSWSVVMWYLWGVNFPGSILAFLVVLHLAVDLAALMLFRFVNRALDLGMHRSEKLLTVTWVLLIPVYSFTPADLFLYVAYLIHVLFCIVLIAAMIKGSIKAFRQGLGSGLWILFAFLGISALGLHDSIRMVQVDEDDWIASSGLSQFSAMFILLCFLGYLSQRFITALTETDRLNRELEDRVAKKQRELESAYDKSLKLELAKSALREREKIYRDLHDDVGTKLVSIIQSAPNAKDASLARSALEDLRAAIFRAKHPELSLRALLTSAREEAELRATAMGVTLNWIDTHTEALPESAMDSSVAYHLARIFREVISNSLRFGSGDVVTVHVSHDAQNLLLEVKNKVDAETIPANSLSNGIGNIRYRAAEITAAVDWQTLDSHMVFTLVLPLSGDSLLDSAAPL